MFHKAIGAALLLLGIGLVAASNAHAGPGPYSSLERCEQAAAGAFGDGNYCALKNGYWYVINGR